MNALESPNQISNEPSRLQIDEAVERLVETYRAKCLWFMRSNYFPSTDEERLRTLLNIERHGDRNAFVRARELREWLLQNGN